VIVVVPAATPVTTPVEDTTVATPVALLLHVPPEVVLLKVEADPTQTDVLPVMAAKAGNGFTVTVITLLLSVVAPEMALRL
jgi:hypothetical protein